MKRKDLTMRSDYSKSSGPIGPLSRFPQTDTVRHPRLFDNLPKLMRPEQVASYLGLSIKTIYDWRYRGCLRKVPREMFLSLNRRLFIRTDVLLDWIASQNPGMNFRE